MELKVANSTNASSIAGAIARALKTDNDVSLRAVGPIAVNQMVKGIAIARGYVAPLGKNLVCVPAFIDVVIKGETKTAITMFVREESKR